ncbi:MAG TPA: EAL domain-containing protein [Pilimelia sp.]|nr:EAL domain-containing protein [Pilimelia sp.]
MLIDPTSHSWSTSQLVEFLAALSAQEDEAGARRAAVERVLESLDAEVGVLFGPNATPTVVGLGATDGQVATLIAAVQAGIASIRLADLGVCQLAAVALDIGDDAFRLLVVRSGTDEFVPEEMLLLRGMAWVLNLALRPLRVMAALHERQRVLEQLASVQKALASRAPLPEVLDAVTGGALALFGCELATLYLADSDELVLASVSAVSDAHRPRSWPVPVASTIVCPAFVGGDLVRTDDYTASPHALPELVERGARAAMAAPVRENGALVGSLTVVSFRPGHAFTSAQEQTLLTFADQVSVALSDAKTLATAQQALRDPVTELPNRVLFLNRLEEALTRGSRVHVLFLDLDRFKLVNDTLGHAAGDELLWQVGRRLRSCLRNKDCLARFGGDEYAVLVEQAAATTVLKIGEQMLAAVQTPYRIRGEEIVVGGSIGIANSLDGAGASDVLRNADTAMYRAKHAGGGRLVLFEQSMHTVLVQRRSLEADLRRAVDAGDLSIVFQPIVDLHSGHTHSAEALVRWDHPERGAVPPVDFIPLAEETGLVVPIGRHVLATACAAAAAWPCPPDGSPPPHVSVNVSARQLLDPSLVADVRGTLAATGLDPGRLILEITEGTVVSDNSGVVESLRQLRDMGVKLALDDFGTGYSSLSYLRMFPTDILKIDRSFVDGLVLGWQGAAFIRTIVRLTETLSMIAVAEGVESEEQAAALRRVGCRLGQGYLFAQPMTPADFTAYLRRRRPDLIAV